MARKLPLKVVRFQNIGNNEQMFSYSEMMKTMLRIPSQAGQGLSFDEVVGMVNTVSSSAAGTAIANPKRLGSPFEMSVQFEAVKRAR